MLIDKKLDCHLRCNVSKLNRKFTLEAVEAWDRGGSGSFEEFLEIYVFLKWAGLCISN